MSERTDEIKVGALVAACIFLLLLTVFSISRCNPFRIDPLRYHAQFQYAGGLTAGSAVRFGGLSVGRVEEVKVVTGKNQENVVDIAVTLTPGTPVKKDSEASITSLGLLGDNYLEISLGGSSSELLPPGSLIKPKVYPSMQEVFSKVDATITDVQKLLKDVNGHITRIVDKADTLMTDMDKTFSDANQAKLSSILKQTDELIEKAGPKVDDTLGMVRTAASRIDPMLAKVDKITEKVDTLVSSLNSTVDELKPELKTSLAQMDKSLEEARLALLEMRGLLNSNRDRFDTILENLAATSDSLREFTNTVKQHPSILLRSPSFEPRTPPEIKKP